MAFASEKEAFALRETESLAPLGPDDLALRAPGPYRFQREGTYVVLVRVDGEPWQVPACVGVGGWNEAPGPAAHSAVLSVLQGADTVGALAQALASGRWRLWWD